MSAGRMRLSGHETFVAILRLRVIAGIMPRLRGASPNIDHAAWESTSLWEVELMALAGYLALIYGRKIPF